MADDTMNIPSGSSERIEFKTILVEMTKYLQQIDDIKEDLKSAAGAAEEKFGIKKKLISKLARTMYKHNYADLQQENEHFSHLYETLIEGKKS